MQSHICAGRGFPQNKKETAGETPAVSLFLLRFAEAVFSRAAERADEIVGKIFKLRAGRNAVLGIADGFVVFPTAQITYIFHLHSPPLGDNNK